MKLNELSDEEFAVFLEMYQQAKTKLESHLKQQKKVTQKEYDKLLAKFFDEELRTNSAQQDENDEESTSNTSFDGMDDLDFDEMNDVWDEMDEEND